MVDPRELLDFIKPPGAPKSVLVEESIEHIDRSKQGKHFEEDVVKFLYSRGFQVAYNENAGVMVDFVAVGPGPNKVTFLVGECQTNFSTQDHAEKLFAGYRKIQDFLNQQGVSGYMVPVYVVNFGAEYISNGLKSIFVNSGCVTLDYVMLSQLERCKDPYEVYEFLINNRYTALAVK